MCVAKIKLCFLQSVEYNLLLANMYYEPNGSLSLQKLKIRARGLSPDVRQIDLDVNRTYRDHIMFMHRYDVK